MRLAKTIAILALASSSMAASCFSERLCSQLQAEKLECGPPDGNCEAYLSQIVSQLKEKADAAEASGSTEDLFAAARMDTLRKTIECWFNLGSSNWKCPVEEHM